MHYTFNKRFLSILVIIAIFFAVACGKKNKSPSEDPPSPPPPPTVSSTITIDRSEKYQQIDGFGFFGARDVWWGNASDLYNETWATQVITDLGITIWRNELYPPSTATTTQDAHFDKQKPVIEGLAKVAAAHRVPLKFIFTVWSPPADLKCALDANDNPLPGTPHAGETKNGGTLDPSKYTAYGDWLADGIQAYKNLGIDVYAISGQNEPLFKQFFNSCFYKPVDQYPNMIKNVMPIVKTRFPAVKVFGSENMLEMEGGADRQYFYNAHLLKNKEAIDHIDILAVHGYSDGIAPTGSSKLAQLWSTTRTEHAIPTGKPYWMTETSGYTDTWRQATGQKPGALNLSMDIHSALNHGNISAWVWWQGSNMSGIDEFSLMKGAEKGKKYHVSKHFYRFIRPGAVRVKLTSDEGLGIFATAFEHGAMGSFTIVLINNADKEVKLNVAGANIPAKFDYYLTTGINGEDCTKRATQVEATNVPLPPYSVVTLVNGNVYE